MNIKRSLNAFFADFFFYGNKKVFFFFLFCFTALYATGQSMQGRADMQENWLRNTDRAIALSNPSDPVLPKRAPIMSMYTVSCWLVCPGLSVVPIVASFPNYRKAHRFEKAMIGLPFVHDLTEIRKIPVSALPINQGVTLK